MLCPIKSSKCLAFLNPGGRRGDLISEILGPSLSPSLQPPTARRDTEASLAPRVYASFLISKFPPPPPFLSTFLPSTLFSSCVARSFRPTQIRRIVFQIPEDALGISAPRNRNAAAAAVVVVANVVSVLLSLPLRLFLLSFASLCVAVPPQFSDFLDSSPRALAHTFANCEVTGDGEQHVCMCVGKSRNLFTAREGKNRERDA